MGAEVVKLEPPRGGRDFGSGAGGHANYFFLSVNRSKRSVDARPAAAARTRGVPAAGRPRRRRRRELPPGGDGRARYRRRRTARPQPAPGLLQHLRIRRHRAVRAAARLRSDRAGHVGADERHRHRAADARRHRHRRRAGRDLRRLRHRAGALSSPGERRGAGGHHVAARGAGRRAELERRNLLRHRPRRRRWPATIIRSPHRTASFAPPTVPSTSPAATSANGRSCAACSAPRSCIDDARFAAPAGARRQSRCAHGASRGTPGGAQRGRVGESAQRARHTQRSDQQYGRGVRRSAGAGARDVRRAAAPDARRASRPPACR